MAKLKQWLHKLPSPLRAALTTAVVVFATAFVPAALGWARSFLDAVTTHQPVPKLSVLAAALVSAALAAASGLVNFTYRYTQSKGWLGLSQLAGPTYDVGVKQQAAAPDDKRPAVVAALAELSKQPAPPAEGPTPEQFDQLIDWADRDDVVRGTGNPPEPPTPT